jgi:prepilin-type N-terminal cleavage/methylation domain-containing protein
MIRRGGEQGLTMIEMLISVMLLSLLSVSMLLAMRVGLNTLGRTTERLYENRRVLGVERILRAQINGYIPTTAECQPNPQQPAQQVSFFEGGPQTLRFVSTYSLEESARGYPRILEYQVIPGERGEGVRLIVNERLYSGPRSTGAFCLGVRASLGKGRPMPILPPVEIYEGSFVLADRLAHCSFLYQDDPKPPQPVEVWVPVWNDDTAPRAIRIDMQPLQGDGGKLQLGSITVPIQVEKHPLARYAN